MTSKLFAFHIREFLRGFGSVLEVSPSRRYINPRCSSFKKDAMALRGDVRRVGGDIRAAMKRNGE